MSPEILAGNYDQSCDMWAAGVNLYIMLCGYPPFFGETDGEIIRCVKKKAYEFDEEEWSHISDQAKDLIK